MYIDPASGGTIFKMLLGIPLVLCAGGLLVGGVVFIKAMREDKKTLEARDEEFFDD